MDELTSKQVTKRRAAEELSEDIVGVPEGEGEAVVELVVLVRLRPPRPPIVQSLLAELVVDTTLSLYGKKPPVSQSYYAIFHRPIHR